MTTSDTLIDRTFDRRYVIKRKLGSGGMADVYLAEDQELGLALRFAAASANEELEGCAEREVEESQQHRAIMATLLEALSKGQSR